MSAFCVEAPLSLVSLDSPGPSFTAPRCRRSARRLFAAILKNDYLGAQRALSRADLTFAMPSSGQSPLMAAVTARRPSLVRLIGQRLTAVLGDAALPQFAAALACLLQGWPSQSSQAGADHACLDALLHHVAIERLPLPPEGNWLCLALSSNNPVLVQSLVDHGASPLRFPEGDSLLHLAVRNEALAIVEWCLASGLSPNLANEEGNTPLHNAVECGNLHLADRLIRAGGNPDALNEQVQTPLSLSPMWGERGGQWAAGIRCLRLKSWENMVVPPSIANKRL